MQDVTAVLQFYVDYCKVRVEWYSDPRGDALCSPLSSDMRLMEQDSKRALRCWC